MMDRKPAEICHPGEHLWDELEARNMTTRELQNLSGIYECFIEDIIDGKENITHALAAGLSKALGTSSEYWMNLQRAWDERDKLKITHDDGTVTKVKPLQMWTPE